MNREVFEKELVDDMYKKLYERYRQKILYGEYGPLGMVRGVWVDELDSWTEKTRVKSVEELLG